MAPPLKFEITGQPEHFDDIGAMFFPQFQNRQQTPIFGRVEKNITPGGPLAMTAQNTTAPSPPTSRDRGPLGKIAHGLGVVGRGFNVAGQIAGSALIPNLMPMIPGTQQFKDIRNERQQQMLTGLAQREEMEARTAGERSQIPLREAETEHLRAETDVLRQPKPEKPEDIIKAYSDALTTGNQQETDRLQPLVTKFLETTKPRPEKKSPEQSAFDDYVASGLSPREAFAKVEETRRGLQKPSDMDRRIADHLKAQNLEDTPSNRDKAFAELKVLGQTTAAPELTIEGQDMAAELFARTGQIPRIYGMQGGKAQASIINRAAEMFPGVDIATNKAEYEANTNSLRNLQKQTDAITAFEKTGLKNLDMFLKTAGPIIDSGSPWINKPLRAVARGGLGDKDVSAYNAARQVALTEISRVVNNPMLTGVLSDAARKEIESLIPEDATLRQIFHVATILKTDMANRRGAMEEQVKAIQGRLGNRTEKPSGGGYEQTATNPKTGEKMGLKDGKWVKIQ